MSTNWIAKEVLWLLARLKHISIGCTIKLKMVINYIKIKSFRGVSGEISVRPSRLNILVGRNNTGKSSVLDAIALAISSFSEYKDVLGKDIIKDIIFSEKIIEPRYLVHLKSKESSITIHLDDKRKVKLLIKLYSDLEEVMHEDRFMYNKLIEWINDKTRKFITRVVKTLEREFLRPTTYLFPSILSGILLELNKLKRGIAKGESREELIYEVNKLLSFIQSHENILKVHRFIENTLKPDLAEMMRNNIYDLLHKTGHLFFMLSVNDEIRQICWMPLKSIHYRISDKDISGILRKVERAQIPEEVLRYMHIPLDITYWIREPMSLDSKSLHRLYMNRRDLSKLDIIYSTHRGAWRFEDLGQMFSEIFKRGLKTEVLRILRRTYCPEELEDMSIIVENEKHKFVFLTQYGSLPLTTLGDGFISLLRLTFIHALVGRKGLLLIEEPETSLHPGYISLYSSILLSFVRDLGQQVFMTTHNLELIEYILKEAEENNMLDEVKVIHLKRENGENYLIEYSGSDALREIYEIGEDLRGI